MKPIQQLLHELIDYAGLFPPAALDMTTMSEHFAMYAKSSNNWMLGRVVVPLARVSEFVESYNGPAAKISALPPALDSDEFSQAVEGIAQFNQQSEHRVDAVEVRAASVEAIANALKLPTDVRCFVEVPLERTQSFVDAIAGLNASNRIFAKVRTGGVKPELIPDASRVADFIVACHKASIGFKATAGLHHPCRAVYPLTYETGCETARMHGFLNVFLTSCFVRRFDLSSSQAAVCLDELTAADLAVTDQSIKYCDYEVSADAIAETRNTFSISFGSCSFTEPIEDLTNLSLLPENPNASH